MQTESLSSGMLRDSTRFLATELVREPVKAAVHDALQEEAAVVQAGEQSGRGGQSEAKTGTKQSEAEDSGGRSKLVMAGVVLSLVGLAYVARKRMQSSWSESAGPEGAGYATEGELQTEETTHQEEQDHSPATE